jgi:hypothetical protein
VEPDPGDTMIVPPDEIPEELAGPTALEPAASSRRVWIVLIGLLVLALVAAFIVWRLLR